MTTMRAGLYCVLLFFIGACAADEDDPNSASALYAGLKTRFIKKNPDTGEVLIKFDKSTKSVFNRVVADNSGCPKLRDSRKQSTLANLYADFLKELLNSVPAARMLMSKVKRELKSLVYDIKVNREVRHSPISKQDAEEVIQPLYC